MRKMYPFLAVLALLSGCAKEEAGVSSSASEDSFRLVAQEGLTPPQAGQTVVLAGFEGGPETRSRIELNAEGTAAEVLWTRGDHFSTVFNFLENGNYYVDKFTTQDDGVAQASFVSQYDLTNYSDFYCFYPDSPLTTLYNGVRIFGLDLPAEQTAVPGGIAEGLNRSFAHADKLSHTLQESLSFRNLTSMLRFRLSGAVASRVKRVRLVGSGVLAGDYVFKYVDGEMSEYPNLHYHATHSQIILSGDFEADTDYYIVLWPRSMNGFRLEFSDDAGNSTLKQSGKTVTFESSRIKDIGTIDLGDEFEEINDGSMDPVLYMEATEGTKPVTIAVVPDGFTRDQLEDYETLAKSGLDALFATEPYKTYKNRFNAYILKAVSKESGASVSDNNDVILSEVHNYFGSRWGQNFYGNMKADAELLFSFVGEKCPDIVNGIHTINEVPVLLLINDSRYGGICWSYNNGQGYAMVPYTSDGGGLQWSLPSVVPATDDPLPTPVDSQTLRDYSRDRNQNDLDEIGGYNRGDWRNTLVHEFGGHCFGRLGDEYWSSSNLNYTANAIGGHSWTVPFSMNLTADPYAPTWQVLLNHRDELVEMDPLYGRIGVFQGGDSYLFGRWRSEKISCMIDNRFYFSAWQRYLITQRIFKLSGDEDDFSFEYWLANDVTTDPVRDVAGSGTPGGYDRNRTYTPVPPLPPPVLVEK